MFQPHVVVDAERDFATAGHTLPSAPALPAKACANAVANATVTPTTVTPTVATTVTAAAVPCFGVVSASRVQEEGWQGHVLLAQGQRRQESVPVQVCLQVTAQATAQAALTTLVAV